jgi:hypothetical protein
MKLDVYPMISANVLVIYSLRVIRAFPKQFKALASHFPEFVINETESLASLFLWLSKSISNFDTAHSNQHLEQFSNLSFHFDR